MTDVCRKDRVPDMEEDRERFKQQETPNQTDSCSQGAHVAAASACHPQGPRKGRHCHTEPASQRNETSRRGIHSQTVLAQMLAALEFQLNKEFPQYLFKEPLRTFLLEGLLSNPLANFLDITWPHGLAPASMQAERQNSPRTDFARRFPANIGLQQVRPGSHQV